MPITDIDALISQTTAFINTMYAVQDDFSLEPSKQHVATCINFADLQEMRQEFIRELKNTVTAFVYAKDKQNSLVETFIQEGRDPSAAWSHLYERARSKFRPSSLQGQFSELLLSNLIQHYYRAAPLLRKMPITTNPKLERNGADALHIKREGTKYILYVGEAKTYNRDGESLRAALADAIEDVIKHYDNHRNELNLYTYEDFLPPDLENIATGYLNGSLDVEVHLICIVSFDCKIPFDGQSQEEILNKIINHVKEEAALVKNSKKFKDIPSALLPRMNYIIFPIQKMQDLIKKFEESMGHGV